MPDVAPMTRTVLYGKDILLNFGVSKVEKEMKEYQWGYIELSKGNY